MREHEPLKGYCHNCVADSGFYVDKDHKYKRCMECNPPQASFQFFFASNDPEAMPDEQRAMLAECFADYFLAIAEYEDRQELGKHF